MLLGVRPARCATICTASASPSAETQHLFSQRLSRSGYTVPDTRDLHPIAKEAWASIHHIYSHVFETPLLPAPWLADQASDATVHLKSENKQVTGSFKARGATHKLFSLSDEDLQSGVVAASTGNHALAVVSAARAVEQQRSGLHVPVLLYAPRTISDAKAERLQELGADLVLRGGDCVEAEGAARLEAQRRGSVYVSPYNDVQVAGGQGSIGVELLMELPRGQLDAVFVPVGGGGLIAGIASVLKAADPRIRVIGCQPAASDVMRRAVEAGRVVEVPWRQTLSEATVGGIEPGSVTLEACQQFVDEWVTVSEDEIAHAVVDTVTHTGVPIEGAVGVAVAAFLKQAPKMRGKHCVIIACGGNISTTGLDEVYRVAGRPRPRQHPEPAS